MYCMELRLKTISSRFSFDCIIELKTVLNEFKSSCFGYYMKDKFILEHPNYIYRQQLIMFVQFLLLFLMEIVIFFQNLTKKMMGLIYLN